MLTYGLLGYWPFDGATADETGNGNNLALFGGARLVGGGLYGEALSLDGVQGSYAQVLTNNTQFDFSGDFTVQIWAKFNDITNGREETLIEKFSGATGPGWSLTLVGGNDIRLGFGIDGAGLLNSGNEPIPNGTWQEFVAERSGNTFSIFWDGTLVASTTTTAPIDDPSPNSLLIAARDPQDGRNFTVDGLIDNVAIWDRALSPAEIAQTWNNGAGIQLAANTYTTLTDPLGTNGTVPFDINDSGQIVGNYVDSNGVLHGFLYSNGAYTSITDPSARTTAGDQGFGTYAHSINDSGQIVGYYVDATTNSVRGFLYSGGPNGTYTTLEDPLADGGNTVSFGINDLGQIVGYYYGGGGWQAFLYSGGTNGTYTTLPNDPSAPGGVAPLAINDLGQIVGYYNDSNGNSQAFLYSNGIYTTLVPPGASGTDVDGDGIVASGINNAGQVVGWYHDNSGIEHGFLYSGGTNGTYTTLDDSSTTPGTTLVGPHLIDGTAAGGINDLGQIVGYYHGISGISGFLANPIPVKFGSNYFEFISDPGISWAQAEAAAASMTYLGATGYLATVTSAAENSVLDSLVTTTFPVFSGAWLGGEVLNGYGYWEVGPLAGQLFSANQNAVSGAYANWGGSEPNDSQLFSAPYINVGAEGWGVSNGQWGDAKSGLANGDGVTTGDNIVGYFVEFTPPTIPMVAVSIDTTDINVASPTGIVTFAFSEAPAAFTRDDTSVVGGTLSEVQEVSPTTYTATFTGAADTDITNASVSVNTTTSVKFGSATATVYEVPNNWAPSQMIDGIFAGPPASPGQNSTFGGVNGWSIGGLPADSADALLTLATPLPAGQYDLTFRIYQNYYGNPGHILGDFALDYTTDASPTLSSCQTPVSIQSASSLNGTTFSVLSPGQLLANTSQNSVGVDTYVIAAFVDSASPITGIFLDAIKNSALPGGGPGGQYGNGNFVVSEFTLDATTVDSTGAFTVDTEMPTVSVSIENTDINVAKPTGIVTFAFSEAPVTFTRDDTSVVGGTLSEVREVNPASYTATFTGAADTDITNASVSVIEGSWQEGNGNAGAGGSTDAFTVDTETPTVSVSIENTDINVAKPTGIVTFAFSEAPVTFTRDDTSVVGGTLSEVREVNPASYTATFTGAADTDITNASVSVIEGSWQEGNGNAGAGGSTDAFTVDTETPTVSVSIDNTDINVAKPTGIVTFTFSEAPVTFTRDDTSVVGGTLSEVREVNPTSYTATFTGAADTDTPNASVSVTPGSWQEGNGNAGAGGSTDSFTVDTETPAVSVSIDNTHINLLNPSALATFTFDKAPTDFSLNDVSSLDGLLSNLSGSGTTYTATFKAYGGIDDNRSTLSVINGSYHDADGNTGNGGSTTFAVHTTALGTVFDELFSFLSSVWTTLSDIFTGITDPVTTDLLDAFQPPSYAGSQTFTVIEGIHQDSIALFQNYLASSFATPSDGHSGTAFLSSIVPTHQPPFLGAPHA
jgi:probable HAF family extracellular repeat protein